MAEARERGCVPIVALRKGRPIPLSQIPYGSDEWKRLYRGRAAVEREMIIIGEAIMQLRRLEPEMVARLHADVASIVAFRNRLVHGYDTVDDSIVFRVATRDVPRLREDVAALQSEREA